MSDTVTPPTQDSEFRRLVMESYQETLLNSVNLIVFMKTPKRDRKGRLNKVARPFREEFLRLFQMTKNIKTITRFETEINNITQWFNITPDFTDEKRLIKFYTIGVSLMEKWNRLLNEQGIVEFK